MLEQPLEPRPVLLVSQCKLVGSNRLIDVDPQRRVIALGNCGDIGEAVEIRLHHDGDEGNGDAEAPAPGSLLVQKPPIARAALVVLLGLGRIIEREFDILEGGQLRIREGRRRVSVCGHRQLDRLSPQIGDNRQEVWMQTVLTGAEVDRSHRNAVHNGAHLLKR